ncbi:MAG: glutamate-5-semialdehyde dehydrogenase [Rhodobiaceae bacterium]|nr:glutamate-5-semialdehyde dehydrogenase [Rhodobiaceae bacterium]RPF97527.1 MAG: glutamate-5-semialdehyde dehydrogenase [Rhizobiales bacterium TMED227]
MNDIGVKANIANAKLSTASNEEKNIALNSMADQIEKDQAKILLENKRDIELAKSNNISSAMIDRLSLDETGIKNITSSIRNVAKLNDPVGRVLDSWDRPNGLIIKKVSIPIGVIGIIYEARPNVTADAASLCLKSGNASILRSGSDSFHSSFAIYESIKNGLKSTSLDDNSIQFVPTKEREAVGFMLGGLNSNIDVIVPRGGKSLVSRVQNETKVPVFGHLEGICHVYVNADADIEKAIDVTANAKMRRTSICGAAETLLIDKSIYKEYLPKILAKLDSLGCEIRGDQYVNGLFADAKDISEKDWSTEYLDAIISVKVVENIDEAISHIKKYGTGHTEAIITENENSAEYFFKHVDSSIILLNASTQFADGGEFGFGAEIGISTGRMHARGPIGLEQLTTFKYTVYGNGQIRP